MISEGDIPAVSLLVTIESEGECVTHRLASLLGLAANLDVSEYDDSQIVPDTDCADSEVGDVFVNCGRPEANMESNVRGDGAKIANIEVSNADALRREKQAGVSEEKSISKIAKEEVGPRKLEDKIADRAGNNSDAANELKVDNLQGENMGLNVGPCGSQAAQVNDVKLASKRLHWKPLPLPTGWFDVYITEVRDADHFTVG